MFLRLPFTGWLAHGDVEAVPDVDVGDGDDEAGKRRFIVVPGRLVQTLSDTRSDRSLTRVSASVSARAARSASVK